MPQVPVCTQRHNSIFYFLPRQAKLCEVLKCRLCNNSQVVKGQAFRFKSTPWRRFWLQSGVGDMEPLQQTHTKFLCCHSILQSMGWDAESHPPPAPVISMSLSLWMQSLKLRSLNKRSAGSYIVIFCDSQLMPVKIIFSVIVNGI